MHIAIHAHAKLRMRERGATIQEVMIAAREGEEFKAKFGRTGFRMNFPVRAKKEYRTKQLEVYGVTEGKKFVVITVIVKYF
jgi:hypothetical protein